MDNAQRDRGFGPFTVGTVVTYTCNTGFQSSWGQISCQPNGQWSGRRPTCTGMILVQLFFDNFALVMEKGIGLDLVILAVYSHVFRTTF